MGDDYFMRNAIYTYTDKYGVRHTPVEIQIPDKVITNQATWSDLHKYQPSLDLKTNLLWMQDFSSRVPSVGCSCQAEWHQFIRHNPPDWTNWFAWTVRAHNAVNLRLGKAVLSLEAARKMYDA